MGGKNKEIRVFFYHPERKEPKLITINSNLNSIKSYLNTQNPKELELPRGYYLYFDPENKDMKQLNRSYGIIGSFLITRKNEQVYITLEQHDIIYLKKHDMRLMNTHRKSEQNMSVEEKIELLRNAAAADDKNNIDSHLQAIKKCRDKGLRDPNLNKIAVYLHHLNSLTDKYGTPYIYTKSYFESSHIRDYARLVSQISP